MLPLTQISGWTELLTTNATDASFASKIPTTTEPTTSTAGVFNIAGSNGGIKTPEHIQFIFFGAGSNNNTFKARVYGWMKTASSLWMPVPLWQGTCTLSATTGVSGETLADTDKLVDTISLESGFGIANEDNWIVSPANDVIAHVTILTQGFTRFEVNFDMNSSATSANCLYSVK